MSRTARGIEIQGEGIVWGGGAFVASLLVGVALVPFRGSIGLENVAIVYLAVVALTSAVGGRAAGLVASLSAALSYNWFFTTPYYTLRIDSVSQVVTVVLLFAAGLLASLGGRASRKAGERVREDEDAIRALHAISQAAAGGNSPDRVAAERLLALLDARAVQVVRDSGQKDQVVAAAGEPVGELDLNALPHLDEQGHIPSGTCARSAARWCCRPRARSSTWSATTPASAPWWSFPSRTAPSSGPPAWPSPPPRTPWRPAEGRRG